MESSLSMGIIKEYYGLILLFNDLNIIQTKKTSIRPVIENTFIESIIPILFAINARVKLPMGNMLIPNC